MVLTEGGCNGAWYPADFYADEAASALCLEKMPWPAVQWIGGGQWACFPDHSEHVCVFTHPDRKNAIAEATYLFAIRANGGSCR